MKPISSAIKPRLKFISERIELVRKKRGIKAHGDILLQAALRSVASSDYGTALRDISKFLQIVPSIKPDERAILTNVEVRLANPVHFKAVSLIIQTLSWLISFLIKIISKNPTGYKLPENPSGSYITWANGNHLKQADS